MKDKDLEGLDQKEKDRLIEDWDDEVCAEHDMREQEMEEIFNDMNEERENGLW